MKHKLRASQVPAPKCSLLCDTQLTLHTLGFTVGEGREPGTGGEWSGVNGRG